MENKFYIAKNIEKIYKNVKKINDKARIVAVTKNVDSKKIVEAVRGGITEVGENRIQEAIPKIEGVLPRIKDVKLHFIGHLQTNKVKRAVQYFQMIQSVDSMKLAEKISKACVSSGKVMDILLEIKVSEEEAKHGINPEEARQLAERAAELNGIQVKGLMAIAPYFKDPENSRPFFRKARELFDSIKKEPPAGVSMEVLSMGMTNDYTAALEEGSNMVRIGRGIFGERVY